MMTFPDDKTLRDLGKLAILASLLEDTMAFTYSMILNETAEAYAAMLSAPSNIQRAGKRAVEYLNKSNHGDLAMKLTDWNSRCNDARNERHRMMHSIPLESENTKGFFRWWHPKSGDVEKFDGVIAMILHTQVGECLIEGRSLYHEIHDQTCQYCLEHSKKNTSTEDVQTSEIESDSNPGDNPAS